MLLAKARALALTDRQIRDFLQEAGKAGDAKAVRIAKRAMGGSAKARAELAAMIHGGQG